MQFFFDPKKIDGAFREKLEASGLPYTALSESSDLVLATSSDDYKILLVNGQNQENLRQLSQVPDARMVLPMQKFSAESFDHFLAMARSRNSQEHGPLLQSMRPESGRIYEEVLVRSAARWETINQVGEVTRGLKAFSDFPEIAMTIASELLTNAFYNAPRDADGNALQGDRTELVSIHAPMQIHFSMGEDEQHFWMKISDSFGTLGRKQVIKEFIRTSSGSLLNVRLDPKGGAGLGLFMILNWSSELIFDFDEGKQTTVTVKILKARRRRDFESQVTTLELFDSNKK